MSYDVQNMGDIRGLVSPLGEPVAGHFPQDELGISVARTIQIPGGGSTVLLSRFKVMRPDGTWATIVQVTESHLRLPNGTWEVFV